ncbi:MAG TPA: alpha/beta hydrolase [Acidimicrobiales bacterium]|nr:alpha/beta hydrolase [Acidimicrobiales bacterium]
MAAGGLAHDDVGDPAGAPVVYLHGTPDSRLARHPDDGIARRLGIRLVAVDRPGFGSSPLDAAPLGPALGQLADHLGIDRFALLGWSSGGLAALGAAGHLAGRVTRLVLVAPVPPVEAYGDPEVLAALGRGRQLLAELAAEMPATDLAAEMAGQLVPQPLTPALALEHVLEGAGEVGRRELASVSGAAEAVAAALQAGVADGLAGVEADLLAQLTPGLDLRSVRAPVLTVHGELDELSPPAVGHWLAGRLATAEVESVHTGGHHLLFPHWAHLLEAAVTSG